MDTPVTPSIGLFHADKQTVEALGPVVQLAKSGFFYCTQGEMSLVLGNRAFEIHRGDIYIYPPLSKTYIRMLSDDLHGTVGVADFDFVFTLANFVVVIPYLLAFFAMFNVGMDGSEDVASLLRSGATIVGFFLGAVVWWILLTLTIDLFRRRFRPRHMLTINHVAGIIIALLGIYTILSTFFTVLPHGL